MNRAAPGRDPRSGRLHRADFDLIGPNPYGRPVAELDGHGLLAGGAALPGQALAFGVRREVRRDAKGSYRRILQYPGGAPAGSPSFGVNPLLLLKLGRFRELMSFDMLVNGRSKIKIRAGRG